MPQHPMVSVIVVNYNGKHLMSDCLSSLFSIDYPKSKFEVIVVDNNSQDGSQEYIKRKFPKANLIISKENLGFTGGNNLGLRHARGEYIVLLNSDTKVDKEWLITLVSTAKSNPRVGIINSKLLFHTPYVEIVVKSNIIRKSKLNSLPIHTPLGILLEDIIASSNQKNDIHYADGFYSKNNKGLKNIRWTKGEGRILVPISSKIKNSFKVTIHGLPTKNRLSTHVTISSCGKTFVDEEIKANGVRQFAITLNPTKKNLIWLVQNAGNLILKNGYSKDMGSVTRNNKEGVSEFYEVDSDFFNTQRSLLAVCGASCLIKRKVIDEVGFLDGKYFMYYEDVDFSLRAWKMGWNILYEPKSIVYHKHRATTGKTISGFFLHMTERNHLAFLLTHFPLKTYFVELAHLFKRTLLTLTRYYAYQFSKDLNKRRKLEELSAGRLRAVVDVLKSFPGSIRNRFFWARREKRSFKQMEKYMY